MSAYVPTCRPTSHPEYTYMAYHILSTFRDVILYLARSVSVPTCRPTYHPEYTYIAYYLLYIDTNCVPNIPLEPTIVPVRGSLSNKLACGRSNIKRAPSRKNLSYASKNDYGFCCNNYITSYFEYPKYQVIS